MGLESLGGYLMSEMAYLEDVCEILDNKRIPVTAKDRKLGKYPYYGANGIQDYVDSYIFDDELVLLAEDGGNFGSNDKPIAYRVSGKCWVNNHAHVLKAKQMIDVDYLCYSIMFYDVSSMINGATRQKLNQADMRKMQIPLPTFEKQKYIVTVLDKVTDLIDKSKRQLELLDELVKARFVEMFGKVNHNRWKTVSLGEICDVRDGTHDSPEYHTEGYPLITSKNVTSGEINFNDVNYISLADFEAINKRSKVDLGDIIMPMIGTIGKPVIVNTSRQFAIKNVALIKFNHNNPITNIFVKFLLQSDAFTDVVNGIKRGGTQKFIALGDIRSFSFYLPPLKLQKQFADFVKQTDKTKAQMQKSLEQLETLKKALMQKYFG